MVFVSGTTAPAGLISKRGEGWWKMKLSDRLDYGMFGKLGGLWAIPAACALVVLFAVTGMPTAHDGMSERISSSGAADIVLIQSPKEVETLTRDFASSSALDEISATVKVDAVDRVLSQVAKNMPVVERRALARQLVDEGERSGIDPLFLAAVIRVESAFSPAAVSKVGARGLMQVMPGTGQELALRMGMDWSGPQQLHGPGTNVRLGVTYLRRLLDYYQGNYKFALTAYNRGPGSVKHLVDRHGHLSNEYTGYFRKIQSIYKGYVRQVGGPVAALLQASSV